ncbi:hypothetical protein [Ornithinimicrobium sp. W1665]|uniref:hypothetical protein n=1 Tax=Ornithinimicrobium sp. W1665 TaxID=3416666 RepID=UPI003CF406EA
MTTRTNTHTTAAGTVGPVCEDCGRRGRAVHTDDGRLTLWDLARGWSTAPYPVGYVHPDGSTGSRFTCPDCNGTRGGHR